jgi:hypothetical protein
LKKKLIEQVQNRKLPHGLHFEDIAGGFTSVGRETPNFFEVIPIVVSASIPMAMKSWFAA